MVADERRDDKEQRLLRQVAALECEISRYEAHFETLKAQLNDYKHKIRELQDIACMLKRAMKDPDPIWRKEGGVQLPCLQVCSKDIKHKAHVRHCEARHRGLHGRVFFQAGRTDSSSVQGVETHAAV